jgi:hypothetical protein
MHLPNPLNKLAADQRARVVEIIDRTRDHVAIDQHDLLPLFEAWRVMFPNDNQRTTCRACVMYVVSNLRRYVAMEQG